MSLKDRTVFITGASRGIGAALALRCAQDGANVVIVAKTAEPHDKLPGTIYETAELVRKAGGNPLAIQTDIRDEEQVRKAVEKAVETFGGIDILINNASAIFPLPVMQTPMKRFDLMMECNVRATFLCSQQCFPYLSKSSNAKILNLSPPISLDPKWFQRHTAYTLSKYGMSLCTIGLAAEFASAGIAVNSLWPKTTVATSAIEVFFPDAYKRSRKPEVVADAAYVILTQEKMAATGQFFVDEEVLKSIGKTNLDEYAITPGVPLQQDLFL